MADERESIVPRRMLPLSRLPPIGTGKDDPFKLSRPPEDGVAKRLSLIRLSAIPSGISVVREVRLSLVGGLSL